MVLPSAQRSLQQLLTSLEPLRRQGHYLLLSTTCVLKYYKTTETKDKQEVASPVGKLASRMAAMKRTNNRRACIFPTAPICPSLFLSCFINCFSKMSWLLTYSYVKCSVYQLMLYQKGLNLWPFLGFKLVHLDFLDIGNYIFTFKLPNTQHLTWTVSS